MAPVPPPGAPAPPPDGYRCVVRAATGSGTETETEIRVRAGHRVLHELQRLGSGALTIGCRGGGCGVCRVRILAGTVDAGRMSARHVTPGDLVAGYALACRITPTSDLVVEAAPSPDAAPTRSRRPLRPIL